uniref:PX domain-containing protein n=1 Tax=Parastrongyloides trichosuri TaxID=131310 RepID=A0A0N4ZNC3_PARTI
MFSNHPIKEDITNPLDIRVQGWRIENGYVKYLLCCRRRINPTRKWYLQKRYSDFYQLNDSLKGYDSYLKLPKKKLFGNLNEAFISERLLHLQSFINKIFSLPILYGNKKVWEFFGLEKLSIGDYKYWVLVLTRNQPKCNDTDCSFIECGWRGNKINYLINNNKNLPKLLSWLPFGPHFNKYQKTNDLTAILEYIGSLKLPFIMPPSSSWVDEKGIGCIRDIDGKGSLRDLLWEVKKPMDNFLKKYGNNKESKSLHLNDIKIIGGQIIESLLFFLSINYPFIDIHCGNIKFNDNIFQFFDIEFSLCGHSCIHRSGMLRNCAVNVSFIIYTTFLSITLFQSIEDMMVFSFGNCLYEMLGCGIFFPDTDPNSGYDNLPEELLPVFKSIFEPSNNILPSLKEIAINPLFNSCNCIHPIIDEMDKISLPKNISTTLDSLIKNIVNRVKEDREKMKGPEEEITNGVGDYNNSLQKDALRINQLMNLSKNDDQIDQSIHCEKEEGF